MSTPSSDRVATLVFTDLPAAIVYYRDVLKFPTMVDPTGAAWVRVQESTLCLRSSGSGEVASLPRGGTPSRADVDLLVDRPYQLYRHLDDLGVHPQGALIPGPDGSFEFSDHTGNTIAIKAAANTGARLRRLLAPAYVDHVRTRRENRRNRREELPYHSEFQAFYAGLSERRDIFFMFFSSGLLHWAAKSARHVPESVNLVLVGSALSSEEQAWVRDHIHRPFFHLGRRVDDKSVLEVILAVSEHDFGWLHIDCLVLNDGLFDEMRAMAPTHSVNAVWWDSSGLATTYFIFVNMQCVHAVHAAGLAARPNCYSRHPFNRHVPGERYYSDLPTRRQQRELRRLLPRGAGGIPYLDTLVMHQLMARRLGFAGHPVRSLAARACDRAVEQASDDVIHIGGVSYTNTLHTDDPTRLRYLIAEYVTLRPLFGCLPHQYKGRYDRVLSELEQNGVTGDEVISLARRHLMGERGLSSEATDIALTL
jgi:hypothetical protein